MKSINIGLIGFGTIGSGVVKILQKRSLHLERKLNARFVLKSICDQDLEKKRNVIVDKNLLTKDVNAVLHDKEINVVIELIGGIHPAKEYIIEALKNKKHVVTANKALLAEEGDEIFRTAQENNVDVCFEASVAGGIPIIKILREGLIANQIENIFGIINGTSNYILSQMSQRGCDFKSALREAQEKGYAEKDPSLDLNGIDSAHKIAILARLCFGYPVNFKEVYTEGISDISLIDVNFAEDFGYCIKLLAIAKRFGSELEIRVHPTLLPKRHLLSNVNGVFNAIFVESDLAHDQLFYGEGAGQLPTASAVTSDLADLAQKLGHSEAVNLLGINQDLRIKQIRCIDEIESRFYIRFSAIDEPGVLSLIASILGKHNISIYSVIQKGRREAQTVPIVMMTHDAKEKNLRLSLQEIDKLPVIKRKSVAIRIERG